MINNVRTLLRQPSTLMAIGCLIGAIVYWWTKSPELALAAAAVVPGAVNDHTTAILTKVEGLEDAVMPKAMPTPISASQAGTLPAQKVAP